MIFEDDLYRINRLADYEYDVDAFLDQITRAERIANPVECATALRRAIEIYGGDYCPEIEDEWASVERSRTRTALSPSAPSACNPGIRDERLCRRSDYLRANDTPG